MGEESEIGVQESSLHVVATEFDGDAVLASCVQIGPCGLHLQHGARRHALGHEDALRQHRQVADEGACQSANKRKYEHMKHTSTNQIS